MQYSWILLCLLHANQMRVGATYEVVAYIIALIKGLSYM